MIKTLAKKLLPKAAWQVLRSKKIDQMIKTYENEIREGNYGGHELKVSIEDPLSKGWYGNDWGRPKEIEELSQSRLKPGAKVFDLGAHQSVVAMMLVKEVGPEGEVLAIEANKHNFEVSCRNRDLNKLNNLNVVHCAVGASDGEIEMSDDLNGAVKNGGTTTLSTTVKALTINTLIDTYFTPDVIFMDIEGFEVLALPAANKALELQADWFIEVHGPDLIGRFGGTVEEVLNFFSPEKYNISIGTDNVDFHPYQSDSELLKDRFYMIATKK